jgi:hypothetical protein
MRVRSQYFNLIFKKIAEVVEYFLGDRVDFASKERTVEDNIATPRTRVCKTGVVDKYGLKL